MKKILDLAVDLTDALTGAHRRGITHRDLKPDNVMIGSDGRLKVRIYSVAPLPEWQRLAADVAAHGRGSDWLKTGGVKGFMDGSLGSHTAAFLEPFTPGSVDPRQAVRREFHHRRVLIL